MRFRVVEDICPVVVGWGHYPESEHSFLLEVLVGVSAWRVTGKLKGHYGPSAHLQGMGA